MAGERQCIALVPNCTLVSRPQPNTYAHIPTTAVNCLLQRSPGLRLGLYASLAALLTAAPSGSVQLVSLLCVFLAQHSAW